ncbi:GuaB1 family IMP dehydrogenase-related protein [Pseudoclavibacter endophyticus]|uniref:GMP reductase n=1 Tax=Pseudoclavibacter endophyticus TaxID=1778590 RepID=A0A6H9WUK0_9MICO|nr:GuaB1 family IMP dehydrogenase-related protein [Pseudoclavibacter endophyticus]KAB1649860.1 GuaB1 family IMP dehydrogenase-related protein [Pseudoclavibacter endophyticus]
MKFIGPRPAHDLTYSDVFLVPSRSDVGSRLGVDLSTDDGTGMTMPIVAANMNAVSGPRLAAAMSRRGGLAVLPQDLDEDAAFAGVAWVKSQHVVWDTPFEARVDEEASQVLRRVVPVRGAGVVVRDDAGAAVGVVEAARLARVPADARIGDVVGIRPPVTVDGDDLLEAIGAAAAGETAASRVVPLARAAFDRLVELDAEFAQVTEGGSIVGTISRNGAMRATIDPPALDAAGRLRVACAVGVSGAIEERARGLVEAGADVLVLDTAHGHQGAMLRAIERVREADLGVPIVAGNVVMADGARDLVSAGADIVKVGVGPGAMCTTRMMTAVGRPQFSAVLETVEAARELGAAVWADGGVRYPRDVALALAAGASAVMIGSWFAGTAEAPGDVEVDDDGRLFKSSFGMASTKAVRDRFADLDPYQLARKELFAEGISSSRILIDPLRPSVEDLLDMITTGVRSSCTYAGASDLAEFRARARVGVQSAAGYEEGKALPVSW